MKLNFFKKSQIDELELPEKPYEYKIQELKSMDNNQFLELVKKIEKYNADIIKVFQSKFHPFHSISNKTQKEQVLTQTLRRNSKRLRKLKKLRKKSQNLAKLKILQSQKSSLNSRSNKTFLTKSKIQKLTAIYQASMKLLFP